MIPGCIVVQCSIKAAGLRDKWDSWGTGFVNTDRWIDIVYQSFTR